MKYVSTRNKTHQADFRTATLTGQPPDRGLYVPERVPGLNRDVLLSMRGWSKEEIAARVLSPYTTGSLPEEQLRKIISDAFNFEFPLVRISGSAYSLELFHGPTLAFKDVGARFMSRCLGYFAGQEQRQMTILVATSGDTGGAVAHAFAGVESVNVIILFPSGMVSPFQERQLCCPAANVTTLAVSGSFDDCQRMVKESFADTDLSRRLHLTSANSINVARWLPQQVYYFVAHSRWPETKPPDVVAVPSGNFGNLAAAILARRSGLPLKHLIAACNANDVFPQYLNGGAYAPRASIHTLSNAMDVGNPSNFDRILHFADSRRDTLKQFVSSVSISDDETEGVIRSTWKENRYLLDPHGAVGFAALSKHLEEHSGSSGYFLETAHPAKFSEVVERLTGVSNTAGPIMPQAGVLRTAISMVPDAERLREFLLDTSR